MKRLNLFTALFAMLFFLSSGLAADKGVPEKKDSPKEQKPPVQSPTGARGFDIVLLMDSSGSMKKTDPQNYRKPAARLFVSLMGESDRIGIISFGDVVKVLSPLTENTKKEREKLFSAINKITSKEYSTNITDAVKKGLEELKSSRNNRIIILMSDGKLALGSKEKDDAAMSELQKILPELAKEGIKLYSVAFTEMSDIKLLENMARETGGFFRYAKTDKDIHVIFASMFEKIKSPDTIPLQGDTFDVDKDVKEATLLITKKPGTATTLIDPSSGRYTSTQYAKNMQWFESRIFDMITIKEPAVGKWKVKLSTTEGNKVFIITNLSLKSSFDKSFVHKGESVKIDAWIEKEGTLITDKNILDQVSFYTEISEADGKAFKLNMFDNGTAGDEKSGDGKYTGVFAAENPGEYSVRIVGEGKTFKREKSFQFKVAGTPPAQHAERPASTKHDSRHEPATDSFSLKKVLINLVLINTVLLVIAATAFFVKKMLRKKKKTS